jgi:hypothetical protein
MEVLLWMNVSLLKRFWELIIVIKLPFGELIFYSYDYSLCCSHSDSQAHEMSPVCRLVLYCPSNDNLDRILRYPLKVSSCFVYGVNYSKMT